MSDSAPPQEAIKIERDGVKVMKSCLTGEFPVPTVGFELTSDRDDEVTVRIEERVPEAFGMDAIGFHSDYYSEHWTAYQDRHLEFERTMGPGESVVTLYGVRADDEVDLDAFMDDPDVYVVKPTGTGHEKRMAEIDAEEQEVEDLDDEAEPEEETPTTDVDADGMDETDGADDAVEGPPEPEPGDDGDPDAAKVAAVDGGTAAAHDPPAGPLGGDDHDSIAARLAADLRTNGLSDADRQVLRRELGGGSSDRIESRVDHLQSRVEEAIAYADPIGSFLDDGGPARVDDLSAEVESVRAEVAELADLEPELHRRMDEIETRIDGLHQRVEGVDERLEEALDDVRDASETADDLDAEMGTVRSQLRDLKDDLSGLDSDVDEMQAWRNQLGELFVEAE